MSSVLGYPCNLNVFFASQDAPDSRSEHLKLKKCSGGHARATPTRLHITLVSHIKLIPGYVTGYYIYAQSIALRV